MTEVIVRRKRNPNPQPVSSTETTDTESLEKEKRSPPRASATKEFIPQKRKPKVFVPGQQQPRRNQQVRRKRPKQPKQNPIPKHLKKPRVQLKKKAKVKFVQVPPEMVAAVSGFLKATYPNAPEALLEWVARQAYLKKKLNDQKRLMDTLFPLIKKRKDCDPVFTQFTKEEMKTFVRHYGKEAIEFMVQYLDNPAHITPQWASRFTEAVEKIGKEKVAASRNAYKFVKGHQKIWEECWKPRDYVKKLSIN